MLPSKTSQAPTPQPDIPEDLWPLRRVRMAVARERIRERAVDHEAEIDRLFEEFGNDPRAALRAVLHDLDMIVADYEAAISGGFVRRAPAADE